MPGKYLFVPLTSFGYLFPSIKVAHILMERGEDVLFAASVRYEEFLKIYGIPCFGIRNQVSEHPFLFPGNWYRDPYFESSVNALSQVVEPYRPTAIVSNPLCLPALVVAEKYNIPYVNIGFSEYMYPGIGEANETKEWRIREISQHYNNNRAKLSLSPVSESPKDSPLIGDRYFIRNIPELDDSRDLPDQVLYMGALYWEPEYRNPMLSRFIEDSKRQKRPIVYMQIGRLFEEGHLWMTLANLIRDIPFSFIADFGRQDYLQNELQLPPNIFGSSFVPLGSVSSDIEFVLCSAQSTSLVSAITHGKPILSIPHSSDAHEFTEKLEAHGIGIGIADKSKLQKDYLLDCFERLRSPDMLNDVERYRKLFDAYDDSERIFDAVTAVSEGSPAGGGEPVGG